MTQVNTKNIVNTTNSGQISFLPGFLAVQSLQNIILERICKELGKSKVAVYNRLVGKTPIGRLEKPVIEKVFAEVVPDIDPWTGDRISSN
jgi:hypothetical protein